MSINIEKILTSNSEVTDYKIRIEKTESYQLFFVHEKLETVRSTDTEATTVTVYVDHDQKKGHSGFNLYASTSEAEAAEKIRNEFLHSQVGKVLSVLVESKQCDGEYFGYTKNYTPVKIRSNAEVGSIKEVKIIDKY